MDIFSAHTIHLTGIKGVAMASLAQCLIDMGKTVTGSDVTEHFVTQPLLASLAVKIFELPLSPEKLQALQPELLIYTSAHHGPNNPEVLTAQSHDIPVLSHAEALAQLFNAKQGIAVCGVGGKSTTSAMISWILDKLNHQPSFSVGVGKIIGMVRTGRWVADSEYFVAEADEYVIDPKGIPPIPRFSFLEPEIIVCTNIAHDHPDVYPDFESTKNAFHNFFMNLKHKGKLVINGDDENLLELAHQVRAQRLDISVVSYGEKSHNDWVISEFDFMPERSTAIISNPFGTARISLTLPGKYNLMNATAATVATSFIVPEISRRVDAVASFQSTQRRFEFVGEKKGVKYYDDYAHHPNEVRAVIQALNEWYPDRRKVIAFQPHTFSRTRQLFTEFVDSFSQAKEVLLLDVFASARESFDPTMNSDLLAEAIQKRFSESSIENVKTVGNLANWCERNLQPGDICLTLGAGDIYQVHDKITK